jgi:hypothetical protein
VNPLNQQWNSVAAGNAAWLSQAEVAAELNPIHWTYNYYVSTDPLAQGFSIPPGVSFIPMIYGDSTGAAYGSQYSAGNLVLAQANSSTGELLTFNEPDHADQANMTPAQAAALWPSIRATGMRISAPTMGTPTLITTPGAWFDQFVTLLGSPDFDFIPVDQYYDSALQPDPTIGANAILANLDAIWEKYHKPIWLKEFAVINFTALPSNPSDNTVFEFMQKMVAGLHRRSFVERFSWYRIGPGDADNSQYFNIATNNVDGSTTGLGRFYKKQ